MAELVVWSDLYHMLIKDSRGAIKRVENVGAVLTSVDNILGTRQGERVMLPEFASTISDMVFERMDDDLIRFISKEVKRVVEQWDDRVKVSDVNFFTDPDNSYVELIITLRIRGYDRTFEVSRKIGGE